MTLESAAQSGDSRRLLEELRDRLASDIDQCSSARDVASLSARLSDVVKQLDAYAPVPHRENPLDLLRARREARRPDLAT